MNTGMLWFDNDPQTELKTKVTKAASYYKKKYGKAPTLCFVHPNMVKKKKSSQGKIKIRTTVTILPNHIWIGNDQTPT